MGGFVLLKSSLRFFIVYIIATTGKQIIGEEEVTWIDNISVGIIAFCFMLFFKWTAVPYDWKKEK